MEWTTLLSPKRLRRPDAAVVDGRTSYQQDLDRIVFSAAFRRLANKTQVHPLAPNDNVRLVAVGIRSISKPEIPFLEANKDRITTFWGKDIGKFTPEDIVAAIGTGPVYITFDIDGFDSSLIPATGTPEPGGLFWNETMDILRLVGQKCNVVGADVVELAPQEGLHGCDFLTSKLVYKILTYSLYQKKA